MRPIANVIISLDTFGGLVDRVNELANALRTEILTANATVGNTTGNVYLTGKFGANVVYVTNTLSGGTLITNTSSLPEIVSSNLTITSNVTITNASGVFSVNTGSQFNQTLVVTNSANLSVNTGSDIVLAANVQINTSGSPGSNGQVLISGGSNTSPSWYSLPVVVDSVSNSSATNPASANAVKTAYDVAILSGGGANAALGVALAANTLASNAYNLAANAQSTANQGVAKADQAYSNAFSKFSNSSTLISYLGYTPANKAGDVFLGNIWVTAANPKTTLQLRGDDGAIEISRADGGAYIDFKDDPNKDFDVRIQAVSNTHLNINGGKVWTSTNDGAGSSLDADLLDGKQGYEFLYSNVDTWISSTEGYHRFHFASGGRTTYKSSDFVWQNSSSVNIAHLDGNGTFTTGLLKVTNSNGAGKNILIGDDVYIGDINIGNAFGITGAYEPGSGFVRFGNSPYLLGCYTDNSTLTYGGSRIWHSGNDGVGSGLDADLLDGQDGSYYTAITSRLGYTPLNKGGDTMLGGLVLNAGMTLSTSDWIYWSGGSGMVGSGGAIQYGSIACTGAGNNGWYGWSIGTWATFMANGFSTVGIHSQQQGRWLVEWNSYGDAIFAANITAYSDERLKKNIRPIDEVTYRRKGMAEAAIMYERDGATRVGFGAQTLEKTNPELVFTGTDTLNTKSVNYGDSVAILAADANNLDDRISRLEALIEQLLENRK